MGNYNTTRKHISFSEIKTWGECSWRHYLLYVLGLREDEDNVYTDYGTIVHDAAENFLETREMDVESALDRLRTTWKDREYPEIPDEERGFPIPFRKREYSSWPDGWPVYADPELAYWEDNLVETLNAIPSFLDEEFPGWEVVGAEEELDEPLDITEKRFKGYIDAVIRVKNKRGKEIYWILDWKTSSARGWDRRTRSNFFKMMQIVLYKHFWCEKRNLSLRDARCGYVLLRRDVKKNRISFVDVSAGPKTVSRALKWLRSMVKMVGEDRALKNRYACTYCEFKDTDRCELNL